jgi:hypothetical protein
MSAQKIEAAGRYAFPCYTERKVATIKTATDVGQFLAYMYSQEPQEEEAVPAADVIVAWFTPYQVATDIDLDTLAAATLGTVVVSTPVKAAE